jgi:hypothetical protein
VLGAGAGGERWVDIHLREFGYHSKIWAAVTLEGTVIHKSGLITGGRSTHGGGKKWEEKDVQGRQLTNHGVSHSFICRPYTSS